MKAEKIADAIDKTTTTLHQLLKITSDEIRDCWLINQFECAKHLNDDEFETLQGLIRKVELKSEMERNKHENESDTK